MLVLQTLPICNPHIGAIGVRPVFSEAEIERVKTSAGAGWEAGTIGAVGASQKVGFVNKAAVRQMTQQQLKVERDGFPINKIAAEVANFNSMAWRFQLCGFVDDDMPWLMRYTAPGDHYDWHVDVGHAANGSRKLGFTVQLSRPDEYDGGDLEFLNVPYDRAAVRAKGALVVFPAFFAHRVTAVTRGTRLALVGWIHGDSYV